MRLAAHTGLLASKQQACCTVPALLPQQQACRPAAHPLHIVPARHCVARPAIAACLLLIQQDVASCALLRLLCPVLLLRLLCLPACVLQLFEQEKGMMSHWDRMAFMQSSPGVSHPMTHFMSHCLDHV